MRMDEGPNEKEGYETCCLKTLEFRSRIPRVQGQG